MTDPAYRGLGQTPYERGSVDRWWRRQQLARRWVVKRVPRRERLRIGELDLARAGSFNLVYAKRLLAQRLVDVGRQFSPIHMVGRYLPNHHHRDRSSQ